MGHIAKLPSLCPGRFLGFPTPQFQSVHWDQPMPPLQVHHPSNLPSASSSDQFSSCHRSPKAGLPALKPTDMAGSPPNSMRRTSISSAVPWPQVHGHWAPTLPPARGKGCVVGPGLCPTCLCSPDLATLKWLCFHHHSQALQGRAAANLVTRLRFLTPGSQGDKSWVHTLCTAQLFYGHRRRAESN